jgi:hypothetical protein
MTASDTIRFSGSLTARRDSRVGVVGLGHMGHAFAANLVADGYQVCVYDRDPKRAATVIGATAGARLGDLAACNVVLTSLPDDDALAEAALGPEGLASILKPGGVHISTSTVSPGMSRRVAEEHALARPWLYRSTGPREPGFCPGKEALRTASLFVVKLRSEIRVHSHLEDRGLIGVLSASAG